MHNTQEIKSIDFDDLGFLSQDNIFKKPTWIFFPCEIDEPRCHSSFYRVLLSLVVRHFCVSVILNSFIITCVVRHFNCPESKIRGHKFLPCPSVYVRDWDGGISVSQTHLVRFWNPFASVILIFLILLFEWEYVSFMMLSCIFWIGPRNGWVSYLNYAFIYIAN